MVIKKIINFVTNNLIFIVSILLIISLFGNLNSCSSNEDKIKIKEIKREIEIAEKRGYFKAKTELKPVVKYDTIYDTIKGKTIRVKNPINEKLLNEYNKLSDSLKTIAFRNAITQREYQESFENDTVKINVVANVTGTLDKLSTDYLIKKHKISFVEKEITIEKKPKFSLYTGVGFLNEINNFNRLTFELSAGFINSKGTHFELTFNTREEVGVSIKKNLFTKY